MELFGIVLGPGAIVGVLFSLYVLATVLFVIMDNRSPSSTYAWVLWFIFAPVLALIVYILFGRSWKAFSYRNRFAEHTTRDELRDRLRAAGINPQEEVIERLDQLDHPAYSRVARLVRNNSISVLSEKNRVEILQDGQEKYPRLMADLRAARHSIHLEYFIWETDEFTQQVKEVLIDRVRNGVEVRLLYDAAGCLGTLKPAYKRELREAGIRLQPYSPIYRLHTISYRNHRKIAVIDGQIGYTGGLNIGQEHLDGGPKFDSWRDTHLRVTGQAARGLQAIFVGSWYYAHGERLTGADYFPPVTEDEEGETPVQLVASGPDSQWAAIRQLYFFMILSAQKHLYLQSPFFILDDSISEALRSVALAGVDVRIMLAPEGMESNQVPYWAAYTYIKQVVEAGAKVYLYEPGYFHAKTLSVDGELCSIGTANMDIRSFSINYELNAVLYDPGLAQELESAFLADQENCREFTLEWYESQSFWMRLRDSLARLVSPLL